MKQIWVALECRSHTASEVSDFSGSPRWGNKYKTDIQAGTVKTVNVGRGRFFKAPLRNFARFHIPQPRSPPGFAVTNLQVRRVTVG
jgi:hypothetical protein